MPTRCPRSGERGPARDRLAHVPLPGEGARGPAVRRMFERIAPRYDLLNRVLALRTDVCWRRRLVAVLDLPAEARVLDLCAGTLDVAAEIRRQRPAACVVGADFARGMLQRGRAKTGLPVAQADALALPFAADAFDAVTVAFGLRNLESPARGLAEIARVLRPGGRVGVLELFRPAGAFARVVHALYNRGFVPLVGRTVSRDPAAYRYLVDSIDAFSSVAEFTALLAQSGFVSVERRSVWPGISSVVVARLP
ncbi:MAG: ubiquinone/menaquinone biosynthesis methyltransferase [Deltaproteobacteria bacterium]|nr:ubiquinone/menaquinone biosynthesis methyltransferase [Deltaproteobacteria bacterium]